EEAEIKVDKWSGPQIITKRCMEVLRKKNSQGKRRTDPKNASLTKNGSVREKWGNELLTPEAVVRRVDVRIEKEIRVRLRRSSPKLKSEFGCIKNPERPKYTTFIA
ncbi:21109_t:CDS:2, partial [Gigaspora rosea]